MWKQFTKFIIGKGLANWLSRLGAIVLTMVGIEQIVHRFGIDLIENYRIDLLHFIFIVIILSLTSELWISHRNLHTDVVNAPETNPRNDFGVAVIMYAGYLKSIGKHTAVVDLRNKLTHLFHLLGLNKEREEFGRIALESCVVIKDHISKSEVLMDDLGWAAHLQGRTMEASQNIKRSLKVLSEVSPISELDKLRARLGIAKANRHLAFLSRADSSQAEHLSKSFGIISNLKKDNILMKGFEKRILTDEAQIHHARAFLIVKRFGLHIEGTVPGIDPESLEKTRLALTETQKALQIFEQVGDLERQAKALVLQERLYSALGEDIEALETKAHREKVLAECGIDGAISSITLSQAKLA